LASQLRIIKRNTRGEPENARCCHADGGGVSPRYRRRLKSWAIRRSKPDFDANHFPQSAYGRLVLIAETFNGSWEVRMPIEFENHVVFDGVVLTGWANDGDQRIRCFVPRQTIGEIQGFTHAPPSEILRRTHEIFERLKPTFIRKIECKQLDASTVPTVTICSRDLHSTR
jgi:hypothetical protein